MPANPSGLRNPFRVSASHGPATTFLHSAAFAAESSSASTSAPAIMRSASRRLRPRSAATRSASPKYSIIRLNRSRSTSTQRPRTSASPSDFANNSRTSAGVSVSPSSVTSMRKSSSASWPTPDSNLPPTLAVTCGRGGRLDCQVAGIRTTTPALSSCGTSRRSCMASDGFHRKG